MDDSGIIALFEKRDQQAVTEADRAYGDYCHAVAKNILGNDADAEEAVCDTWLQAWNSIPPQKPTYLKLFLGKITRNLALSAWRRQSAQKRGGGQVQLALEELSECVSDGSSPEGRLEAKELAKSISDFLRKQPTRDRGIFLRRYYYLEDTPTVARCYGLKEDNVLQILSRTRRKLKLYLIKEGYDL